MTELEYLNETVAYYSENPLERRCKSNNNTCFYSPISANKPNSEGCAIGRKLLPEDALVVDEQNPSGTGVEDLISEYADTGYIPDWMLKITIDLSRRGILNYLNSLRIYEKFNS